MLQSSFWIIKSKMKENKLINVWNAKYLFRIKLNLHSLIVNFIVIIFRNICHVQICFITNYTLYSCFSQFRTTWDYFLTFIALTLHIEFNERLDSIHNFMSFFVFMASVTAILIHIKTDIYAEILVNSYWFMILISANQDLMT